jgi:hypothetical protein
MDSNNTSYLKDLRKRILNLHENEYKEILKIIINNNCKYSENNNGVFINMSRLPEKVINEIENILLFCEDNKIRLQADLKNRNNLLIQN